MTTTVDVQRIPRSVSLSRAADGSAVFNYLDERLLPGEVRFEKTGEWQRVVDAVKTLAVRGAPAIGAAGAAAVALWAVNEGAHDASASDALSSLRSIACKIADARPTAINLRWAVERMLDTAERQVASGASAACLADALFDCARGIEEQDEATNRAIGTAGASLIEPGSRILTHCNAGSLATVFFGTALGVVYAAAAQGKVQRVYADETRPIGQGARLTSWELARAGVPVTVICDNMAASLMARGRVDAVIVGADRIARNGDVANKIGTYGVAVLAAHHGIPFYVAAPASTFDLSIESGDDIPIEERSPREVMPAEASGVKVWNPAFDVTPAALVTRIITEFGAFEPTDAPAEVSRCLDGLARGVLH